MQIVGREAEGEHLGYGDGIPDAFKTENHRQDDDCQRLADEGAGAADDSRDDTVVQSRAVPVRPAVSAKPSCNLALFPFAYSNYSIFECKISMISLSREIKPVTIRLRNRIVTR